MKIAVIVDHARGISGPHRNVVGTLNALSHRADIKVTLLTGEIDSSEPYAHSPRLSIQLGFKPNRWLSLLPNLIKVWNLVRQVDVVYVPSGLKACLYASLCARILGKRIITGPNVTHLPIRRADSPGSLEVRFLTDLWLEASQRRRDHVRAHLSENLQNKVINLHHSIDTDKFTPQHRRSDFWKSHFISTSTLKVLYVGRDNIALKGVKQLFDAIDWLETRKLAENLEFIFVGRMSDNTKKRAQGRPNIHLLGFQTGKALAEIYANADLGVVPSTWENFPFVVLEALSSGLPVIATRTGGIPELIEDGTNGALVDIVGPDGHHIQESGEIIGAAIHKLVRDETLRKRLGSAARKTVLEKFNEDRLGEELVSIFRSQLRS